MTDARNLRNSALAQFRASPWPWRWTLVLVAVDLIWLALSPISLAPLSIAILLANGLVAVMVFAAADSFAQRPRLGFFIEGFVFLAVTFPYLRLFNHLTMSIPLPLADPLLAGIDRQIGFDWLAYVHWADGHPLLVKAMSASYSGLTGYTAVMFALLAIGPER